MCGHTWLPVGFWVPKNCVCSHSRASTGLGLHPDGFFIFFFFMVLKEVSHVCLSTALGALIL